MEKEDCKNQMISKEEFFKLSDKERFQMMSDALEERDELSIELCEILAMIQSKSKDKSRK